MLKFVKFVNGGGEELHSEKRLKAVSGYAFYTGQALKVSGGRLIYAGVGDIVYGISNVSVASSVATGDYVPEIFVVNENQVWRGDISTAMTAAFLPGAGADIGSASNGTAIRGDAAGGTGAYVYAVGTGDSPASAAYVVFKGII